MKLMTIIVKPFRAEAVLKALAEYDLVPVMIREAKGYSRQKGYLDRYVGSEYSEVFLPKVEVLVHLNDNQVAEVSRSIAVAARTGRMGDGKIFVASTAWPEPIEF